MLSEQVKAKRVHIFIHNSILQKAPEPSSWRCLSSELNVTFMLSLYFTFKTGALHQPNVDQPTKIFLQMTVTFQTHSNQ